MQIPSLEWTAILYKTASAYQEMMISVANICIHYHMLDSAVEDTKDGPSNISTHQHGKIVIFANGLIYIGT